ncbi:hypothetical protein OV079_24730 [Nannocystis pusilla]|uniref:Uncharacterized protein n=1 Tax=Nannocystis pusilla TaxID=889268 RepID=A0A9X3ERB5_9BACT|nr:hypothetical protein [Nannocystis pusilla]MCY1008707.1 hypothetical protein [Nannocystis pusilla]
MSSASITRAGARHVGAVAVDAGLEVGLVRAAAVVVGAPAGDAQAERERLHRPRLVARQLEAFDVTGEALAALADHGRQATCPFRQEIAGALAAGDRAEPRQDVGAEAQRPVDEAALGALHRERQSAAGRDRVEAERVAGAGGREQARRVVDVDQRPESELSFVLDARAAVAMVAADRAAGAAVAYVLAGAGQPLGREATRGCLADRHRLEVTPRQDPQAVEGLEVGRGPERPILLGRRPGAARREIAGPRLHARRVRDPGDRRPAHADRLDPLGPEHRPRAAAPGVPAVVGDRRIADLRLAGGADRRYMAEKTLLCSHV